jgi:putative transposase
MNKMFSYRLYPSKCQRERMVATLETCRRFYNDCLHERKAAYETEKLTIGLTVQSRRVKVHKKNNPFASDIHSHVLQVVVSDLQKSMDAFFRRVKLGEKPGYPRFKPMGRFRSFGFKELGNGFKIDGRRLRLWNIGRIAVRWHRPLEGKVKSVRIKVVNGKWYAVFCCEVEANPLPACPNEVGIDAGLSHLFVLATGSELKPKPIQNPRWYRKSQGKLRRLQRSVARKKKGGSNRNKAVQRCARFSERVANHRKDYLNKVVCLLVATYGFIAIVDLNIAAMSRSWLAKSILDAGWGYFRQRLCAKAESAGRTITLVAPAYTTQDCCKCGRRHKLSLKDRWYLCECGNSMDRDENAANNVLTAGRAVWAPSTTGSLAHEATPL